MLLSGTCFFLPFFEFLLLTKQGDLMCDNTNKEVYR